MKKFKTEFSKEELHNALNSHSGEAKEIIEDKDKWEKFKIKLEDFLKKAEKIPVLGGVIDDVTCMVLLVDSYIKKEYRDIPVGTIISIVGALIYVVSPIDLIPDVVPVIGFMDDAVVITLVLGLGVSKDLKKYRKWRDGKRGEAIDRLKKGISNELADIIDGKFLVGAIISDEKELKMLLSKDQEVQHPIECVVKTTIIPLVVLSDYDIVDLKEILELFETIISEDIINWANGIEHHVYYEPDFDEKWDDYVIREND